MRRRRFLLLLLAALSSAQAAPAGLRIQNQAAANYRVGGQTRQTNSASVAATVATVCAPVLSPAGTETQPGQDVQVYAGQEAQIGYTLSNLGNATTTYSLSAGPQEAQITLEGSEKPLSSVTLAAGAAARLLVKVKAGDASSLLQLTATCPDATRSASGVARLNVSTLPQLKVSKSFSAPQLHPGEQVTVTVTVSNTGNNSARHLSLTDLLGEEADAGLIYVVGSAQASLGQVLFSSDESTWSSAEGSSVRGLQLNLDELKAGETVTLRFKLRAVSIVENRTFESVATLKADGLSERASANVSVRYRPTVALGPLNHPQASGDDDAQTQPFAVIGQTTCFDHSLQNTGDVSDSYTLKVTGSAATLQDASGQLLGKLTLAPGERYTVRVCYAPQSGSALEATVTAYGTHGQSDATIDRIARLEAGLPPLKKTVTKAGAPNWQSDQAVSSGDVLTYTLSVTNPYTQPLHGVTVSDTLPAGSAYAPTPAPSAGAALSNEGGSQRLSWQIGDLAAGETRSLSFSALVSDSAQDGQTLRNTFSLSAREFSQTLVSNEVNVTVWNAAPFISKVAQKPLVAPGDLEPYTLTLRNTSPNAALIEVQVQDTPAPGLNYVSGTSTLDGKAIADPQRRDGHLIWTVDRVAAQSARHLSYTLRVGPAASGTLTNSAQMQGVSESGRARAASAQARAEIKVKLLNLAPQADILGRVFLDVNGDGQFSAGDSGVGGARILLAGGQVALTDAQGRYHFANLKLGPQALRLDPASVPAQPSDNGTRSVYLTGLSTVDFPLRTISAVSALRDIDLQLGDLSLHKTLTPTPEGYRVTLTLSTPVALPNVQLNDPLPGAARLSRGQATWAGPLPAGTTTLSYDFDWPGSPQAAVTDPQLKVGAP